MSESFVDTLRRCISDQERKKMNDWVYLFLKNNGYDRTCTKLEQVQALFPMNIVKLPDGKDNRLAKKWKVVDDLEQQICVTKSDIHDKLFEKKKPNSESPFSPSFIPLNQRKGICQLVVTESSSSSSSSSSLSFDDDEVKGHCREVTCFAHHPRENAILTGAPDSDPRASVRVGKVSVWKYDSGSLEYEDSISNIPIRVTCINFNDFGDRFAIGVGDFSIYVYSYPTLQLKMSFPPENHNISCFCFSYPFLFSGSDSGVVRMYHLENQKKLHTFEKPREGGTMGFGMSRRRNRRKSVMVRAGTFGIISCLDSVVDDRGDTSQIYFAIAGGDRYAYVFSRRKKELVSKLQHQSSVSFVRFLPKSTNQIMATYYDTEMTQFDVETAVGHFIISAGREDSHILVWASSTGKVIAKFEDPQGSIAPIDCFVLEDGRFFVVLYQSYTVLTFELATGRVVKRFDIEGTNTTSPPLGIHIDKKTKTLVQVDNKNIRLYECF